MTPVAPVCPVPLFDKLQDNDPENLEERVPFRTVSLKEFQDSVRRDLSMLLNHRRRTEGDLDLEALEVFPELENTVLLYGAPDFSNFNYRRDHAWQARVEEALRQCILFFEPRFQDVEVEVTAFNENTRQLSVIISGAVKVDQVRKPIAFPIDIQSI